MGATPRALVLSVLHYWHRKTKLSMRVTCTSYIIIELLSSQGVIYLG